MSYAMHTTLTEAKTRKHIVAEFDKWRENGRRYGAAQVETYDFPPPAKVGSAEAQVRFVLRGKSLDVRCSSQHNYGDNLRCVFYAVQAMRMNETRGIADTMAKAYLQLSAPTAERDAYEVLGVRPDTPLQDIEAMYLQKAKRLHSDKGGDDEEMVELNAAIERVRADKGAS